MSEAATPTGGAEGSARPSAAAQQPSQSTSTQSQQAPTPQTVAERLRATMFAAPIAEPQPDEGRPAAKTAAKQEAAPQAQPNVDAAAQPATADAQQAAPTAEATDGTETDANADGAQGDDTQHIKSIKDLAEGLSWDTDRVMDLEVPVKINGKEGSVPLREALKSYQLEGHLNQGLMKLAEERKAFEAETGRKVNEFQAQIGQLNKAVGLAQKILDGEFANVDWQELQRTDPTGFQAKYGAYKMRLDGIQQLNGQVMQEQEREQAQQQAALEAYRAEQSKLLDTKIPEWSDTGKRDKDVTELVATLSDAYGITEKETLSLIDHRHILLARDAMRWQKLQKSKPATLQKVRTAPKLIKPGSQQSRTAQDGLEAQKDRDQLRRTGKVQDAAKALKRAMFS